MSIWKELYDIFNKERARWEKSNAHKQALVFEIQSNVTFLADAIKSQISQSQVVIGLERTAFDQSIREGVEFNSIAPERVSSKTIGGYAEFKKYRDKDTEYLVKNAYAKMGSLTKLINSKDGKDYSLKIKSIFRFLILLIVHVEGRCLPSRIGKISSTHNAE